MKRVSNNKFAPLCLSIIILFSNGIMSISGIQVLRNVENNMNWTDMVTTSKTAISTLPSYTTLPPHATNWSDYAERSINDLLKFDDSWFNEPSTGIKGFRPYVKGADGWGGEDCNTKK